MYIYGKSASQNEILAEDFGPEAPTGATSVSFNGTTAAAFTINSTAPLFRLHCLSARPPGRCRWRHLAAGRFSGDVPLDARICRVMRDIRDEPTPERLIAMLAGFFGILAAVLAMVGL